LIPVAAGCRQSFPLPMTAVELMQYNNGQALTTYLSQRDASPSVCDPHNRGPHFIEILPEDADELADSLYVGRDGPKIWKRCVESLVKGLPKPQAMRLMDAMALTYKKLLKEKTLDEDRHLRARLDVLHQIFLERPNGLGAHKQLMAELTEQLQNALDGQKLGPTAVKFGQDLLDTVELEQGSWQGRPVDARALDKLQQAGNEKLLRRFALRLPDPQLREQAQRRVVRLRIAASQFPEVQSNAAAVEEIVMKYGRYPISPLQFAPTRAALDGTKIPLRGVLVRQKVYDQTATLLGYGGDRPGVSVLPELRLRGAFTVELAGISRPVTLCGPKKELDPTPCIASEEVKLGNPTAYLDTDGAFHFVEHVKEEQAVVLVQGGGSFLIPVAVGNKQLMTIKWGLTFERPEDLIFSGESPGAQGPEVGIVVDARDPRRVIYTVTPGESPYLAVVENRDVGGYHAGSRGAQGYTGRSGYPGRDGSSGSSGQSASCPSSPASSGGPGGDGSDGGPGGPGGPGGHGGDVVATLYCGGRPCDELAGMVRANIFSQGGQGGFGGQGGRGGSGGYGGSGGSGTSCSDGNGGSYSLASGSQGPRGRDGAPGMDGPPGMPGRNGRVRLRVIP
jgi:hypothetical protein